VLRLNDIDIRPAHRGEFRVLVAARRTGLGQLRAYLAADLIRRWSERTGLAPTVIDLSPDGEPGLRAACADLNIHPPRHTLTPPVASDQLAGQFADGVREPVFDVGVAGSGEPAEPTARALASHWIETAAADGTGTTAGSLVALGEEPLSVRYHLMRHGYGERLSHGGGPDGGDPDGAELARWRELVARWAESPSGAMSPPYAEAITAAFADDLDTPAALGTLAALADDPAVPDGVKFETFAAADRLFGLDLARDVGR
jgi:hypothetical protein